MFLLVDEQNDVLEYITQTAVNSFSKAEWPRLHKNWWGIIDQQSQIEKVNSELYIRPHRSCTIAIPYE